MQLSHDHILPFEGITNDFGPLPALVSLWMENGSLSDYLKGEFPQLTDPRKLELVSAPANLLHWSNRNVRYSRWQLVFLIVRPIVNGCGDITIYS